MQQFINVLAASFAGVTGTAIVLWFAKTWIGEWIKGRIEDTCKANEQQRQAENDRALEEQRSALSRELEGWRAGYQKALDENRIRFTKLHEDRATAIKELYGLLVVAEEQMRAFVSPISIGPRDEAELRGNAQNAYNEFSSFFTHERILFSEPNCELIDKIRHVIGNALFEFTVDDDIAASSPTNAGASEDFMRNQRRASQKSAYDSMTGEFKTLKKQLERDFRTEMGIESLGEMESRQSTDGECQNNEAFSLR